jgi:hypothetical protein
MTAIAAFCDGKEIVIAADSAVCDRRDGKTKRIKTDCKIRIYGGFVFAVQGMPSDDAGYNVHSIAEGLLCGIGPDSNAAKLLAEHIHVPLHAAGERLQKTEGYGAFRREFERFPLRIVLATMNGKTPMLWYIPAEVTHGRGEDFSLKIEPELWSEANDFGELIPLLLPDSEAKQEHKNPIPSEHPPSFLIDRARQFVQFMIDRKKDEVGPPINIVQVTESRISQIQ